MSNISFSKRFGETEQAQLRCLDVVEHDKISGDINLFSGEMTFGRLDRKLKKLTVIMPNQIL